MGEPRYSVVIPVFDSAPIVGTTIDRVVEFFRAEGLDYELILVNDASRDRSAEVIFERAAHDRKIVAIDLIRNYGQHTAIFCGLQNSRGDWVITLDDDLQNPPEEMRHLIRTAEAGHDVVFGKFREKRHPLVRRLGSKVVGELNQRLFRKPPELVVSNFRIMSRDVVRRITAYRTAYPYITGLALLFSSRPANVEVEHVERPVGRSGYTIAKLAELVLRILFNYSAYPLRLVSWIGGLVSAGSFVLGTFYLVRHLIRGTPVPGWTSTVVLLSFFNGFVILLLSMLGEYTVRLLNQTSESRCYHVARSLNLGPPEDLDERRRDPAGVGR